MRHATCRVRATSSSICVDFELGHLLQRCYCSFVVPEICEVPALLAELPGQLALVYCAQLCPAEYLHRSCSHFPNFNRRLRSPSLCTRAYAAFWWGTLEAAPRWWRERGKGQNLTWKGGNKVERKGKEKNRGRDNGKGTIAVTQNIHMLMKALMWF